MRSVLSAIIFLLVFYGNHFQQSYVAGQDQGQAPPCEGEPGFCQGLYPCKKNERPCCPFGEPIQEGERSCRKANAGEPCDRNIHCESANCDKDKKQCDGGGGGKPKQNKTEDVDGPCVDDRSCDPKQSLVCKNKKCSCKPGFSWSKNVCDRVFNKTFRGTCTKDSNCITERQLKCINKKCGCAKDFIWSEAICEAKVKQTECDPLAETNECTQSSTQMECDEKEKICRCPLDMEFSSATQSCKLQAGKNCTTNNTMDHDRCASQRCEANGTAPDYTCECGQVDGVAKIWSSDPGRGCVTDYFMLPCTRPGYRDECRPGRFNASRDGLICKDYLCQCEKDLTYRRGYCVKANLLFNGRCDPDGFRPTCQVLPETSLTCRDVGGGDFRCVCLLRDVTVRNRRETVALTWNADEKKCDLKPPGERCNGAYECRSGDCKVTCQVALPRRQRATSTGTKILNYAFLIILFSLIATQMCVPKDF